MSRIANIEKLIGRTVVYRARGGARRTVVVEDVETGGKNGRDVFDGTVIHSTESVDEAGDGVWGYVDDIIHIV